MKLLLATSLLLATTAAAEVPKEADLRAQTTKLIDAMAQHDVDTVLTFVSRSGISVGVGADNMKLKDFEKSMRKKSGVYCALMDSHCIEDHGRDMALIETLRYKTPLKVAAAGGAANKAIVTTAYGSHESELHFVFEDGAWKLTHLEWN